MNSVNRLLAAASIAASAAACAGPKMPVTGPRQGLASEQTRSFVRKSCAVCPIGHAPTGARRKIEIELSRTSYCLYLNEGEALVAGSELPNLVLRLRRLDLMRWAWFGPGWAHPTGAWGVGRAGTL